MTDSRGHLVIPLVVLTEVLPMEGCKVVMWGWGRLEAGVLWVVRMAGLVEMEVEPPPQSESSMFPPLLQPAPHPFCNLHRHVLQVRPHTL